VEIKIQRDNYPHRKAAAKKKGGLKRKSETPKENTSSSSRASTPSSDTSSSKAPTVPAAKTSLPPPPPPAVAEPPEAKVPKEEPVETVKEEPVEPPAEKKEENLMKDVSIPDDLRRALVDDWYLIQKLDKLYNLPAKHTVRDILDGYIKYKLSKKENDKSSESCLREVAKGIFKFCHVTAKMSIQTKCFLSIGN
jgi:MRG